jgi:hypothetical protein
MLRGDIPLGRPTKNFYTFLISAMRATHTAPYIFLALTIFYTKNKLWNS